MNISVSFDEEFPTEFDKDDASRQTFADMDLHMKGDFFHSSILVGILRRDVRLP